MQSNTSRARFGEEGASVIARVRRNAAQLAFLVKVPIVVESRHVAEMDAGDGADSSAIESFQSRRDETAGRSEENRRIHFAGEITEIVSRPSRAKFFRLANVILAARDDMDFVTAVKRDLNDDVGRAAEPNEEQPALLRHFGPLERAISDQAAAEQRRNVFVVETLGQFVSEILRRHRVLGVSAIHVVSGVARVGTEVLAPAPAKPAGAVHMTQPGDTNPLPNPKLSNASLRPDRSGPRPDGPV